MKLVLALVLVLCTFDVASADISNGTIDGRDWRMLSNDHQYGLVVGYILGAKLRHVSAKQLVDSVSTFYSNHGNHDVILEDAISTAHTPKPTDSSRPASPPLLATPSHTPSNDHLKAGGSAYKDYTLPQNQPVPQPTYQQQQINNGNGGGRYGNYPSY